MASVFFAWQAHISPPLPRPGKLNPAMFENLSEKLQRSFKTLRGQGTLTDENINDALRSIRVALLESDVNLDVTRKIIEDIRAKALGT